MKKYLLGIGAVVLAVGMSAFTAPKTSPYVYFPTDELGNIQSYTDGSREENAFGCPDAGQIPCAKGFLATRTSVVEQNLSGIWQLKAPSAPVDDVLHRNDD